MKKIFVLMIAFLMLMPFNTNAGINSDDFTPKNEISSKKNQRKIKTIQKLISTKIGKWIVKKAIKKLQKNQLKNGIKNDIKIKNATKNRRAIIILSLGALLLLGGIGLIIGGYTALGIILGVLGLAILITFIYLILLISNAFSQYKGF